jgi:3-oxo-5-alpha-steroid 4-dehydrogenase 1
MAMELVSPVTFYLSLTRSVPFGELTLPTRLLASAFLIHYANRAVISVLRQRGRRSPMAFYIPLFAASFNLANGHALGTWLSGFTAPASSHTGGALPPSALASPVFLGGLALWLAGFLGNLAHDEILLRLRGPGKPAYSLPRGLLYDAPFGGISYPNYLCEWLEWLGFALAATFAARVCPPALVGGGVVGSRLACPPWVFLGTELATMSPRALSGHRWYRTKFGKEMPRGRKAVIPGVL